MAQIIEGMESILTYIVEIGIVLLELFGVCVLLFTAVKSFLLWLKKEESVRLDLAQGIALALEFKMGGEVLRTVLARERSELVILGAIILLRGVLTFLIHWEIKNEKKEQMEKAARQKGIPADREE